MLTSLIALAVTASPSYAVVQRIPIGGEGGWDCIELDSHTHRLFISRGTHVTVLDVVSGKLVRDIPNTNGVHDIALVDKHGKGYISDGRDNAVTVIDLKTLKELKRIAVGSRPDVMAYDPSTDTVFSMNPGSSDATAIDPRTDTVRGTVKLDGRPEFAKADGHGSLFVNLEDKSAIDKVDVKSLKAVGSWSLAPGESPTGLAYDAKRRRLFSACDNGMMVVSDAKAGKVIATPKIGNGPDGAAFDPGTGLTFSPNGQDGTLTVLGPDYSVLQTVTTQRGARTMSLDPKSHRIYLIAAKYEPAAEGQRPRIVAGSATVLVVGEAKR